MIKYFFHNKKRTYRAVAILAVGLALVMSTDMLIGGYISQVESFAGVLVTEDKDITVSTNNDVFSQQQLTQLRKINSNYNLSTYVEYYSSIFLLDVTNATSTVIIADIDQLRNNDWVEMTNTNITETAFISDQHLLVEDLLGQTLNFRKSNFSINQTIQSSYISLERIWSDFLIDRSLVNETKLSQRRNIIQINVQTEQMFENVMDDLEEINGITIDSTKPARQFLRVSGRQVTAILFLLQIGMSILLVLSISYSMINLIHESKEDLRIFKMIGLQRLKVFLILLSQSLISAFFAFFVALIVSILLLYTLLPFVTFAGFPYGSIRIDPVFLSYNFLQAIGIGLLSGIYPAWEGSK